MAPPNPRRNVPTRSGLARIAAALGSGARRAAWLAIAAVAGYAIAAAIGASLTVGDEARAPADGIDIWLRSNGVHVELVLPVVAGAIDWQAEFPREAFAAPPPRPRWVAFGWGAREFFVHVREWKDLTASRALRALMLEPGVLHVEFLHATDSPVPPGAGRRILVSAAQHAALVEQVRAAIVRDAAGRPIPLAGLAYGRGDAFFEATGRYSPVLTCNEWVNRTLRRAGVPTVAWAPFAQALVR